MTNDSISSAQFQFDAEAKTVAEGSAGTDERLFDAWFDPIEHAVRDRVRSFIEELIESERRGLYFRGDGGGTTSTGALPPAR